MKTEYKILKPSIEELHARFDYKDGALYWKDNFRQRAKKGNRAGYLDSNGYRQVRFGGTNYLEHRIIWALHHNNADEYIDHIDGDISNNKIENLRVAGFMGNALNAATRKDNTSGSKNVYWNKKKKYWEVRLNVNKKQLYVGSFGKDFELASFVASECRRKYRGEFASDR